MQGSAMRYSLLCFKFSLFCIQDLANQIRHSLQYQDACAAKGLRPGRFLSVPMAEYLSGLPAGWTSPHAGAVDRERVDAQFAGKAGQSISVQ